MDGTPIIDIKPYVPFTDCIENAVGGYATAHETDKLQISFPPALLEKIPQTKQSGLIECLADDPRPSYQEEGRIYGMRFGDWEIKFVVQNAVLEVLSVENI